MATPTTTIDALPAAASITGSQLLVVQEVGVTKKTSVADLTSYVGGHITIPMTAAQISALANPNVAGTDVQAQLTDLTAQIQAAEVALGVHLADTVDAHDATAISAADSGGGINGADVQAQLGQLSAAITVKDVMWVGPEAPTDPNIEMWFDTDAPSSTSNVDYASNAETIAGVEALKAVTPASLKYERNVFDVRSYGAIGDGTTDDTAALQAAMDAAAVVHGTVVFPAGYTFIQYGSVLLCASGCTYTGGGTIRATYLPTNIGIFGAGAAVDDVTFDNLHLQGIQTTAVVAGRALISLTGNRVRITNVTLEPAGTTGISLADMTQAVISNCIIRRSGEHGIYLSNGCRDITVDNCTIVDPGYDSTNSHHVSGNGIKTRSERIAISNCVIRVTTDSASTISGPILVEADGSANSSRSVTISNCVITGHTSAPGIRIGNLAEDVNIVGNIIKGPFRGIYDLGSLRTTITGNTIDATAAQCLHALGTGANPVTDMVCTGNTFVSTSVNAVELFGLRCVLSDNTFLPGCANGVNINTGSVDCYLVDNLMNNVANPALPVDAIATTYQPRRAFKAVTYAASITPDVWHGHTNAVTLTGDIAVANPSHLLHGVTLRFIFTQDGTGGRTVTWGTALDPLGWTVNPRANSVSVIEFVCNGTAWVRSSASSFEDVTPLTAPLPTGLVAWYDAADAASFTFSSGVVVSQWNDKSGLTRHLTSTPVGSQPSRSGTRNGKSTVVFDAARFVRYAGTTGVNVNNFTVFFTLATTNDVADSGIVTLYGAAANDYNSADATYISTGSTANYFDYFTNSARPAVWAGTGNMAWSTCVVTAGPSGTGRCHRDGVLGTAGGAVGGTPAVATGGIILGARWLSSAVYASARLAGEIGEVLIYDRALDNAQRQQMESYLKTKWGTP